MDEYRCKQACHTLVLKCQNIETKQTMFYKLHERPLEQIRKLLIFWLKGVGMKHVKAIQIILEEHKMPKHKMLIAQLFFGKKTITDTVDIQSFLNKEMH